MQGTDIIHGEHHITTQYSHCSELIHGGHLTTNYMQGTDLIYVGPYLTT